MPQRRRTAPWRVALALALAAVASRTQAQVSLLRAPGSSTDDGQFLVGGLSASGRAAFLAQYSPIFTTYLNAVLGTALGRTFVTVCAAAFSPAAGAAAALRLRRCQRRKRSRARCALSGCAPPGKPTWSDALLSHPLLHAGGVERRGVAERRGEQPAGALTARRSTVRLHSR